MSIVYGSGLLFLDPTAGNLATNPTPGQALTTQNNSVDISQKLTELRGQLVWPEDTAPGDMTGSGKVGIGRQDLELYNQIFLAGARTTGTKQIAANEPGAVPGTGPYTVSVVHAATFLKDEGVRYASGAGGPYGNGKLQRVATSPTVGQYNVSAGVYTFAAGDTGAGVLISYVWNSATTGSTVTVTNQVAGIGVVFELWLQDPYQNTGGLTGGLHLFACRAKKLGQERKRDGYMMPTIEFDYFANPAGLVMEAFDPGL